MSVNTLSLQHKFKNYIRKFYVIPFFALLMPAVLILALLTLKYERDSRQKLLDAEEKVFVQGVVTSDTPALTQELKAVSISQDWKEASILLPSGLVLSSFPDQEKVNQFYDVKKCTEMRAINSQFMGGVGSLCWTPRLLRPLNVYLFISCCLLLGVAAFFSLLIKRFSRELEFHATEIKTLAASLADGGVSFAGAGAGEGASEEADLLKRAIRNFEITLKEQERSRVLAEVAAQVAHDIRSPLTALNVALSEASGASGEAQALIRGAVERIQNIASALLQKNRKDTPALSRQNMAALIEEIILEKQVQIKDNPSLKLETCMDETTSSLFSKIDSDTFKTVLSNIISNSFEAIKVSGVVTVGLKQEGTVSAVIWVKDTGAGISPDVVKVLGTKGATFGKENHPHGGSGLGLYHAKKSVAQWNGRLDLESQLGQGTTVYITLPTCE